MKSTLKNGALLGVLLFFGACSTSEDLGTVFLNKVKNKSFYEADFTTSKGSFNDKGAMTISSDVYTLKQGAGNMANYELDGKSYTLTLGETDKGHTRMTVASDDTAEEFTYYLKN